MRKLLLATCLTAVHAVALAQAWERVLVPVTSSNDVPGAHGSLWRTEFIARNDADVVVRVDKLPFGGIAPPNNVQPHTTFEFPFYPKEEGAPALLLVATPHNSFVTFNLRVRDMSRQAETWGTEIPVVREKDYFRGRTLSLLNVPTDERFRQNLRVFDIFPERGSKNVTIRMYDQATNQLLVEQVRSFVVDPRDPSIPGRIQINHLAGEYEALRGAERIRIEIVPADPTLTFWAFVTVTNNATQHVTTISPQ